MNSLLIWIDTEVLYLKIVTFNDCGCLYVAKTQDFIILGSKAVSPTAPHCILNLYCELAKLYLLESETESFLNLL